MTALVIYSIAIPSPRGLAAPPLPEIPRGSLVIVEGRAPCAAALHRLHGSPAAAQAADPRPEPPATAQGGSWDRSWM